MSISPDTRLFMEARAICLMGEKGRAEFLDPTPSLAKAIAEKLAPYANDIAGYGNPPTKKTAWDTIAKDIDGTDGRTGQINMDMLDIANIYVAATAYLTEPSTNLLERIQSARIMLRCQAFSPDHRKLGEAAATAIAQPDFRKGSFVLTV